MATMTTKYITKNPSYKNSNITVKGFVLHSIGVSQPSATVMQKSWNKSSSQSSVHAVCDPDQIIVMLPCLEEKGKAKKCWGCGSGSKGSYNNSMIQIEMCEPSNIKYIGGATFTCTNKSEAIDYVKRTMDSAAQFIAECCYFHGLNPLDDGVIETHKSAHDKGYASNHGDPNHLWTQLGMNYTLDDFRNLVAEKLEDLEDNNMTDEKFKELADRYFANKAKEPASSWSSDYLSWVKDNGIMVGDTSGNQMPQSYTKREELSTMLKSFYTKFIAPIEEKLK